MTVLPKADGVNQTEGKHVMLVHFIGTMRVLWYYFMLGFGLNSLNFVQRR